MSSVVPPSALYLALEDKFRRSLKEKLRESVNEIVEKELEKLVTEVAKEFKIKFESYKDFSRFEEHLVVDVIINNKKID